MAISVVQRKTAVDSSGTTGTVSGAFGSSITAGNAILVVVAMNDTSAALFNKELQPPTDTLGNKYYQALFAGWDSTSGAGLEFWIAYNSPGGANTISISDNGNECKFSAYELAGVASYAALDQVKGAVMASNATFNSGTTSTTAFANEILIGGFVGGSTVWVAGSGYSNIQNINGTGEELGTEEQIVSATGTYSATATHTASTGVAGIATLADTGAAAQSAIKLLGATYNTTSGTHTVTATPAVNDLIIIVASNSGKATTTAPTDNNSSGTYTLITSALKNTSADILEIYVRDTLIGAASSTVFTQAPGTTTGGGLAVYSVKGMTKTGATAVKQSTQQVNQAANATPAPAFGGAVTSPNPVFTAVFNTTNSSVANTVGPVGFANSPILHYGTPATSMLVAFSEGGQTGTAMTFTAQSPSLWSSVAVELDASSTGTLHTQSLTASMTPSGAFTKSTAKALTASMLSTGILAKKAIRAFTASMTPSGVLAKKTIRGLTGSLGLSGILTASHVVIKSLTASMTPSGVLSRKTNKPLTGSLPLSGVLAKLTKHNLTGTMTSVGSLAKKTLRNLTGSMTPSGTITGFAHKFTKALTGSMTPTGSLLTGSVFRRSLTASITFTGSLAKQTNKKLTGSLPLSGAISRLTNKLLTGSIGFSGLLSKATNIIYRITQLFISKPSDISLSVAKPADVSLSAVKPADISLTTVASPDSELTAVATDSSVFSAQSPAADEITVIKPPDDSVSIIGES